MVFYPACGMHHTMELIEPLILNQDDNIAEYNINVITELGKNLGLDISKLKRSSNHNTEKKSSDRLCEITIKEGGSVYLCGGGADGYQKDSVFKESGLALCHQNFSHPLYHQHVSSHFVKGLSIIDALMNLGTKGVGKILGCGR